MAETVTLYLSDDVMSRAKDTARQTGRRLEDVLTDWIAHVAASQETALLLPGVVYPIYNAVWE